MTAEHERELLVMQLLAARAQIDATLVALGVRVEDGSDVVGEDCKHPPEKRVDHGVLGGPERWECTACGYEHNSASKE